VKYPTAVQLENAMIINSECKGVTPVGAAKAVTYEHPVKVSTTTGHIEAPYLYQPYAKKLEFCVTAKFGTTYYKYESPSPYIENKIAGGTANIPIYLKEGTGSGYFKSTTTAFKCP
jgi:hypothetical protein